jgi:DNA-directed RNA polymerase specialized sigma24 family protein
VIELTEHELVARVACDDPLAWRCLYNEYLPQLSQFFAHLTDSTDADVIGQLVEETMLKVWLSRASFEASQGSVYVWIMRQALEEGLKFEDARSDFHSYSPQRLERRRWARALLRPLSTEERAVVHFVYTGRAREEIAAILSVPRERVDIVLYEARIRMRIYTRVSNQPVRAAIPLSHTAIASAPGSGEPRARSPM